MQARQVTCSTILIGPILHCRRDYHPSEKCHVSAGSEGREWGGEAPPPFCNQKKVEGKERGGCFQGMIELSLERPNNHGRMGNKSGHLSYQLGTNWIHHINMD